MFARLAALLALLLAFGFSAVAQDRVWTGSISTDFRNMNNWSPAGVPDAADKATINGTASNQPTITAGTALTIGQIELIGGTSDVELTIEANVTVTTLTLTSSATTYAFLSVSTGISVQAGTLNMSAAPGLNADISLDPSSSLTVSTAMSMVCSSTHQSRIMGTGAFTLEAAATLSVTGSMADLPAEFQTGSTFNGPVSVSANRVLNLTNGGTYRVHNTMSTGVSGRVVVLGASILDVESGGQLSGTFVVDDDGFANFDTTQTGTLTLSSSGTSSNPAGLSGGADPLFGSAAAVTITAESDGAQWNTQDGDRNAGTMMIDGQSFTFSVNIQSLFSFVNSGTLVLLGDTSDQASLVGAGSIVNQPGATLQTSGGSGGVAISCGINNMGTLQVSSGQLTLQNNYSQSSAGARVLLSASNSNILFMGGATTFDLTGGSLEGVGSITGNLMNSGLVRPGGQNATGTLIINGNYTQVNGGINNGVLEFEFDDMGNDYDVLTVNGVATLTNRIHFVQLNTLPTVPKVYSSVLTTSSTLSGSFTSITNDVGVTNADRYFNPTYLTSAMNVSFRSFAVPAAQNFSVEPAASFNGTLTSTDVDGDSPTYSIQTAPSKGSVNITNAATGAFTYTANVGVSGTDQFSFIVNDGLRNSKVAGLVSISLGSAAVPVIASAVATPSPAKVGSTVTFTAVASDPASQPLTYSWDFQDGQPHTMGNPITHVFPNAGSFTVILRAFNGSELATMNVSIDVLGPNSGGETIINVGDGKDPITNPLNGITLSIASSNGGVVELAVDINALIREGFDVNTGFDTIKGRQANRQGLRPTNKFVEPGVAVATTVATDAGTTTERGKARRQIAVSSREVGQVAPFTAPPADRMIATQSMKGKFLFSSTKPDQFTFVGSFELPEGLDLSQERTLEIGIGNVVDSVTINAKGKSSTPILNRISKAQIKYPKVSKDSPLTTAGQKAKLTLTMKGVNFSGIGFDTEGIAATLRGDEAGSKSVPRSIQTAISFAGSTWEGSIPVDFKLTKNADSGTIQGRRAN